MRSIALPVLLVICFTACKKEKSPDDYIVKVGNQAFGVYLNGQPWVADYRDAGSGIEPIDVAMLWRSTYSYNYLWATASKQNEQISIFITPPLVPGRRLLNTNTQPYPGPWPNGSYGMYGIYNPSKRFMTTTIVTGYVDILSCDTMRSQIEARFEFEAVTAAGEKIKVTNGYLKKN